MLLRTLDETVNSSNYAAGWWITLLRPEQLIAR
jgi:hypothetical protein